MLIPLSVGLELKYQKNALVEKCVCIIRSEEKTINAELKKGNITKSTMLKKNEDFQT